MTCKVMKLAAAGALLVCTTAGAALAGSVTQPDVFVVPTAIDIAGKRLEWSDVKALLLAVEVLSPGTQSVDLADKLADYFRVPSVQVPSVQHYLVVRATRREVIHHRRIGADSLTQVINLGSIALDPPRIAINVADLYPAAP